MAEYNATGVAEFFMISSLPLIVVLVPLISSVLVGLAGIKSFALRNMLAVASTAVTLVLAVGLFIGVLGGFSFYYRLPALAGVEISFSVDLFGSVFALFTAAIWFLATLASVPYMLHEERQTRYYVFLIMSLAGCIGVFLSGDFLSLFLFFELMTLAAYALVVHTQTGESMSAGGNYLYLGVIGGLSLLSGIILLNANLGTVAIAPLLQGLAPLGGTAVLIALLMIAGFGVKAGMLPLHIWLPQAHPVAPSPASALLSGIMIKTGAYGIIRISTMLFTPEPSAAESAPWHLTENIGHVIIWVGIATMLLAALMAVLQNNAKRLLAYSSVSQMGYILMGIGAAAYLGFDGPMGFGGFSYHIINHAFFKSGMFVLFGVIYARLHEKRMDQLGGLWRKFPFTFAAFAFCAAGITGIPGFNGYVSKTLLHHAIVEAFEYHHLWDLWVAEKLFMLTSGLTVCYIAKLFVSLFLGKTPAGQEGKLGGPSVNESWSERVVALSFMAVIAFLGLFSHLLIPRLIVPMSSGFTYSDYYLNYLAKTSVWNMQDLLGIVIALALGAAFYTFFKRKELFSYRPPDYLSVEASVYRPLTALLGFTFTRAGRLVDNTVNGGFYGAPAVLARAAAGAAYFDEQILNSVGRSISDFFSGLFNLFYELWAGNIRRFFSKTGQSLRRAFMVLFKFDYSSRGDRRFQTISIKNIDFDLYILLIVIGAILVTSLLFIL